MAVPDMDPQSLKADLLQRMRKAERLTPSSAAVRSFLADVGKLWSRLPPADQLQILRQAPPEAEMGLISWDRLSTDGQWALIRASIEWALSSRTTRSSKA